MLAKIKKLKNTCKRSGVSLESTTQIEIYECAFIRIFGGKQINFQVCTLLWKYLSTFRLSDVGLIM